MSTPTVLRPEIIVPLKSGPVLLRDLPWQDALEFLKRLSTHAKDIMAAAQAGDGKLDLAALLPRLTELIANVGELSTFLLTKSAGRDEEWLEQFGTLETLALLDGALEVNLTDGLLELGKRVTARLARVMPANPTTSATPASATS